MRPIAADIIIIKDNSVLLVKRKNEPFKGMWAFPGGRLEENETIEECAKRECMEETGLRVKLQKLVGVYSDPKRDPRKIVGVAFLCRITGGKLKASDDAEEVRWFDVEKAKKIKLAFDHNKILMDALKRMKK
ncbi:MAG: NUDIX hydrolase [Candidatus Anstonellales archaeon]